jgi:hypothetical protein
VQDLYSLWNIKFLETYFSPASKGEEVWLQIELGELDSIGPELGGEEGFLNAVRGGPTWETIDRQGFLIKGTPEDLVSRVRGLVRQRQFPNRRPRLYGDPGRYSATYRGKDAPTYLPYLVALVRSILLSEEGFYSHLCAALQLHPSWGSQQMERLSGAWADLEAWTRNTNGEFGRFNFRTLGGYPLVGVPKSQSIMSRRDCELVSRVFAQVGARPGQQLNGRLLQDIKLRATNSLFLTAGFRDALGRPAFDDPVSVRLKALFEDWDGKVPDIATRRAEGWQYVDEEPEDVELCLRLSEGNDFPWLIHLRVPPLRDSGELVLKGASGSWTAAMHGTEPSTTAAGSGAEEQATARALLSLSSREDVEFKAHHLPEASAPIALGSVFLRKAILRVFVWSYDDSSQKDELREHALPLNGPAFLLAAASNARQLEGWLNRENVLHQLIETPGLPDGWLLVCLPDCHGLTQEQRSCIPDGECERVQHRPIRLAGGRSVRRGGLKQYMSYDLPFIELDAPEGARVHAAGLRLAEEPRSKELAFRSGIRRYRVTPEEPGPRLFTISAVLQHQPLGSVTLRVASDSGEQVEAGRAFSLDRQGSPRQDALGLRGMLPAELAGVTKVLPRFRVRHRELGRQVGPGDVVAMQSHGVARFLDTLAQMGSMAYGPARDQLARMTAQGSKKVSASTLLLDLRSRGFVEIETNARGHLTRVHAVPAALYELQVEEDGQPVFGILGTPRLQQWEGISAPCGDFCVYHEVANEGCLGTWRVLAKDVGALERIATAHGFTITGNPSMAIAQWAATRDEVATRIEQIAGEGLGAKIRFPERLNPEKGWFFPVQDVQCPARGPAYQLFRMEDRDIGRLQVYRVGVARDGVNPRYGFVRDSRWGVWIALGAFADFVKLQFKIESASPWPVPYLPGDGTVLLPARISLPVVLERTLALCNGRGPYALGVEAGKSPVQGHQDIPLLGKDDGVQFATISQVYSSMASGTWLAYRHVPEEVASVVASKVGGRLVDARP